jgi:dephospho-CoA kinase
MLKIGLTGSIGSGKTTIAKVFTTLGVPVYFSDTEAKKILDNQEVIAEVIKEMGYEVIDSTGKVDRKKMANKVFNNVEKLQWLNSLIHPRVRKHFMEWVDRNSDEPYIIQESAIMLETGFSKYFDKIIVVSCPLEQRIQRVVKRDGMSREEMMDRMENQWSEELKLMKADLVIKNDDELLALPQIMEHHEYILKLASKNI